MARAIDWAISRDITAGGNFLAVNVGSNGWNYQVRDLAEAVATVIPDVEVSINKNAQPDKRLTGWFDLLNWPDYQQVDLTTSIES
jgi:hypothetical protein